MGTPSAAAALEQFRSIMGTQHVLTSERRTAPYARGNRYGSGKVLAVLRPGTLVQMWQALQVCLDHMHTGLSFDRLK